MTAGWSGLEQPVFSVEEDPEGPSEAADWGPLRDAALEWGVQDRLVKNRGNAIDDLDDDGDNDVILTSPSEGMTIWMKTVEGWQRDPGPPTVLYEIGPALAERSQKQRDRTQSRWG